MLAMSETKVFCSVIVFTLGVYTIILLQYELFKLNNLNTDSNHSNNGGSNHSVKHNPCSHTLPKAKFDLHRLNCGSAGELLSLAIQNCTELPCEVTPNVNYTVVLNFSPSRNISNLEIQTFVRQKRDLKYLHKESLHTNAMENTNTTLKFSFAFPSHQVLSPRKMQKISKCPSPKVYMVGLEIWDLPSGIGEVCLIVPVSATF